MFDRKKVGQKCFQIQILISTDYKEVLKRLEASNRKERFNSLSGEY